MSILCLQPLALGGGFVPFALTASNPPMTYDKTLGTPSAQAIVPPFQNLPAHIDEITGTGPACTWNYKLGIWN